MLIHQHQLDLPHHIQDYKIVQLQVTIILLLILQVIIIHQHIVHHTLIHRPTTHLAIGHLRPIVLLTAHLLLIVHLTILQAITADHHLHTPVEVTFQDKMSIHILQVLFTQTVIKLIMEIHLEVTEFHPTLTSQTITMAINDQVDLDF